MWSKFLGTTCREQRGHAPPAPPLFLASGRRPLRDEPSAPPFLSPRGRPRSPCLPERQLPGQKQGAPACFVREQAGRAGSGSARRLAAWPLGGRRRVPWTGGIAVPEAALAGLRLHRSGSLSQSAEIARPHAQLQRSLLCSHPRQVPLQAAGSRPPAANRSPRLGRPRPQGAWRAPPPRPAHVVAASGPPRPQSASSGVGCGGLLLLQARTAASPRRAAV